MLLINGLKFTSTLPKSFSDFDNMFKAIDRDNSLSYSRLYIATLVYDKVILERDQARAHEVNAWIDGHWFPTLYVKPNVYNYETFDSDSVGDIED